MSNLSITLNPIVRSRLFRRLKDRILENELIFVYLLMKHLSSGYYVLGIKIGTVWEKQSMTGIFYNTIFLQNGFLLIYFCPMLIILQIENKQIKRVH